jgi:hypothetical protein
MQYQQFRPRRHVTIPEARAYGGDSRSRLYELAALHPGLFVKSGRRTFVCLDAYDRILDARPVAIIKGPQS